MFGRSWRIARIAGIPVNVDSSWVWIAVLLTFSLTSQFGETYGSSDAPVLAYAVATAVLFFGSVFLHELAHAVAARLNGIEVFGITLVIFGGFTTARSDQKGPGPSFVISAVGPATSLVLAGLFWALSQAVEGARPLAGVFGYVGWVNGFMAVFNVLPGLPLDGGRMLEAVVWRLTRDRDRAIKVAAWAGIALGLGVIGFGVVIAARGDLGDGLWPIIIGVFILQGARAAERQIGLRRRLRGARVADAMGPPPPAIAADLALSQALDRFATAADGGGFPVLDDGGRVIGVVTFASARPVGMRDPMRPVRDAVIPLSQVVTVDADEPLEAVAARVGTGGPALVLRDGRLVGELSSASMARWIASSPA